MNPKANCADIEKYGLEINKVYNEDCLIGMKKIKDKSIDMILCDLPYGTTDCKWDSIIPLDELWEQYKNMVVKRNIAHNTSTPPDILMKFAGEKDELLKFVVASNIKTPLETLEKLSQDENKWIRKAANDNPNIRAFAPNQGKSNNPSI